jgi:hypothetical protein
MKNKETLEDFIRRESKSGNESIGIVKGAKWQAEKMYSEEEVRELLLTQRGNCYVAILTKTRDSELASLSMSAPEPSGKNGWVKQLETNI